MIPLFFLIGIFFIGVSYAYWKLVLQQTGINHVSSTCFEVSITNEENAFPITDEKGMEQSPYTFTITNTCDTYANYQVNLEILNNPDTLKRLDPAYIKLNLNGGTSYNLQDFGEVDPTLDLADKAFFLTGGTLAPSGNEGDHYSYELRLWMDENTPLLEETMNAVFESKISVTASYIKENAFDNGIVLSYESKTPEYTSEKEIIEIRGSSNTYNIVEISYDGILYEPIKPAKSFIITKEYTEGSVKEFYVKDEVGNIEKIEIELQHLDQSGPLIQATQEDKWGSSNTVTIQLEDEKSGLSGYQITTENKIPEGWKEVTGASATVEETVSQNGTYYIFAKDSLGNVASQSVQVNKIDNINPTVSFTTNVVGGNITVDASSSHDDETRIVRYEYKLDNGEYYPSETNSYTFINASHGTHTVSVRVTDEAGNQSETSQSVNVVVLFTITYDANGGSGAPTSQTKTYGVNLTLSSTKPTRTGHTFLGWSTDKSATSATYAAGGTFSSNANTTLYAIWKANTYTINYNANGGSGAPSAQSYTYATSGTINLSSTKPTRAGYVFQGWSLSSSGSVSYQPGQAWSRSNASNYTLYAIWKTVPATTITNMSLSNQGCTNSGGNERAWSCEISGNRIYIGLTQCGYGGGKGTAYGATVDLTNYTKATFNISEDGDIGAGAKVGFVGGPQSGFVEGNTNVTLDVTNYTGSYRIYLYFEGYVNANYRTDRSVSVAINSLTLS